MVRLMISALAIFAGAVAMMGLSGVATAQRRIAFVAGTDKYDNLEKTRQLQRAVNDARAVGAAFKNLGFEVLAAENLTRGQFNALWQKFLDSLNAGDTAAIYYAGHGVEIEGLNFLLPRDIPDIKFGRQEQIKRESVSVAELLLDLRSRSPEVALIILDACRDNPLIPEELRSVGGTRGGLAPFKGEPPKGTFIMYSAGAGESARSVRLGSMKSIVTTKEREKSTVSQISIVNSRTPTPSTSTSPTIRAISSPSGVRCRSAMGQDSTPRNASARTFARIRALAVLMEQAVAIFLQTAQLNMAEVASILRTEAPALPKETERTERRSSTGGAGRS